MKQFSLLRLLGAKSSGVPFKKFLSTTLDDSRLQNPVPSLFFSFPKATVRYVRFEVTDLWGTGGCLQFAEVLLEPPCQSHSIELIFA